ncbi:hypothetical protein [Leisingera caerulea]|uniref:Uncharacterized protein n=1 Tax=Leisingera caerulea TaxID=506591 RepID=A0A9Q9HCQ9_LEICA|nr:hypothetical protein [Leisingera caerulea]UWQ52738.1 hypothetical protein K3721_11990 [Leisingera caerulea]
MALGESTRKPRKDRSQKLERLCEHINEIIALEGQEFDGHIWAILPQKEWAAMLGVDERTIRRLIKMPPIQTTTTQVEGVKATLLRVGKPGKPTPRTTAQAMAGIFRKRTEQSVNPNQFGCLVGLAEAWPDRHELEIFKYVTSPEGWEWFMTGLGLEIAVEQSEGKHTRKMFFKHPHIPTLRRYAKVAFEAWRMHLMEKGKWPAMPLKQ